MVRPLICSTPYFWRIILISGENVSVFQTFGCTIIIVIKAVVQHAKTNILITLKFGTILCNKNMVTYLIAKFWTITIS